MNTNKKKKQCNLRLDPATAAWLKSTCKKQVGNVSQSTLAERIFRAARKNPQIYKEQ